jgi:hypothetical protein
VAAWVSDVFQAQAKAEPQGDKPTVYQGTSTGRPRHRPVDARKELIARLKERNPNPPARKICELIDQTVDKAAPIQRGNLAPLKSWQTQAPHSPRSGSPPRRETMLKRWVRLESKVRVVRPSRGCLPCFQFGYFRSLYESRPAGMTCRTWVSAASTTISGMLIGSLRPCSVPLLKAEQLFTVFQERLTEIRGNPQHLHIVRLLSRTVTRARKA